MLRLLISTSLCSGEPAVWIICTLDSSDDHSVVEIEEELMQVEFEEGAHIAFVEIDYVDGVSARFIALLVPY